MGAAIVVHVTSTLQITTPGSEPLEVFDRSLGSGQVAHKRAAGSRTLEPGVYRIDSDGAITVEGAGKDDTFEVRITPTRSVASKAGVTVNANGKDGWPDPPPKKAVGDWARAKVWLDARSFDPAAE